MMNNKPSLWADALLILWVVVVGVVYFGGLFVPVLAALTGNFAAFYAVMVLASALALARRFLHPPTVQKPIVQKGKTAPNPGPRAKTRK